MSTPLPTTTPTHAGRRAPSARRRTVAVTATALALVLGLGACGTSGGEKANATPTKDEQPAKATTTTTEATTTTGSGFDGPIPNVDDPTDPIDPVVEDPDEPTEPTDPSEEPVDILNRLEHINIAIDDLPEGWEASPSSQSETSVIEECTTSGTEENMPHRARWDSFALTDVEAGGALGLDGGSGYLVDDEVGDALMDELKSDDFAACAGAKLLSGDDSVSVEGAFQQVDIEAELGEDHAALQGDFVISDSEQTLHLSAIVVTIRTGRVVTNVVATAVNVAGDEQLLYGVLDVVSQRQAETA